MTGRYLEEFREGETFVHEPSRTITESDNVLFCSLTMNPQPLHLDHAFAAATEHGQPLVNGIFTLGLVLGLSVHDTTLGTTLGNLGFGELRYDGPVYVGDTITAETTVLSVRRSRSRPDRGIVEFEHRGRNQRGETILTCRRSGMMMVRPGDAEVSA